jgi:hypothetical protein
MEFLSVVELCEEGSMKRGEESDRWRRFINGKKKLLISV